MVKKKEKKDLLDIAEDKVRDLAEGNIPGGSNFLEQREIVELLLKVHDSKMKKTESGESGKFFEEEDA